MYYFKKNKDVIEKYSVDYDLEKLQTLKLEIINKCSRVENFEYDDIRNPKDWDNFLKIRNYSKTKIKNKEELFHYKFTRYEFPYLVKLIDELIYGNALAIDEIIKPNMQKEALPFNLLIQNKIDEINIISDDDKDRKLLQYKKLLKLIELAKLNKNQKPIKGYYKKVKDIINLDKVDELDINLLNDVSNFFDNTYDIYNF
ncbi:MAG: hypothetical protein Q4E75_06555 [bacterium]|nr:hypothetical protein [bacterium]